MADCPGEFADRVIRGFGNDDGKLDSSGLLRFYEREMPTPVWTGSECPSTKEEKQSWFSSVDLNGDSKVDKSEFTSWAKYLCENTEQR